MLEKAKKTDDALTFLQNIIQVVEITMDGTSGALYAIFLNALAPAALPRVSSPNPRRNLGQGIRVVSKVVEQIHASTAWRPNPNGCTISLRGNSFEDWKRRIGGASGGKGSTRDERHEGQLRTHSICRRRRLAGRARSRRTRPRGITARPERRTKNVNIV
jgi:hypothetical protein